MMELDLANSNQHVSAAMKANQSIKTKMTQSILKRLKETIGKPIMV